MRAYVDKRRLEIIRASGGCVHRDHRVHSGCILNDLLGEMDDAYVLAAFEFDHIDPSTKLCNLSETTFFTRKRGKRLGFKDGYELWEAEAAKCRVLCAAHHALAGRIE